VVDGVPQTRQEAIEADRLDPLAQYRDEFLISPGGPIYLDGNSLGRQPRATAAAVDAVAREWGRDLVGGWERWIDLPGAVGDRIGELIGAAPGQVVVGDSTTVNLYKLAVAAMDASPGRRVIVGDKHDFPTVRYVLQGVAARAGGQVRLLGTDPVDGLGPADVLDAVDDEVALVCLSAANYRSGAVVDLQAVTSAAHQAGALTLWDLSHAAGVVPVDLDGDGADLAVGCTYKYLNGGPGAPAWLYVRADLQATLRQPVWGWWGQRDQFSMGVDYDPAEGIDRFLAGTPAVLGIASVDAGIAPLLAAGIPAISAKARRLVSLLAQRAEELLVPLGARIASPSAAGRRGGHFAISHPHSLGAARLLIERGLVVPDFRPPDVLRLAPVPLYTSFVEVWDAAERIATVLADPAVHAPVPRKRVT
jgi:kynureninase